jgi:hypothetical protein
MCSYKGYVYNRIRNCPEHTLWYCILRKQKQSDCPGAIKIPNEEDDTPIPIKAHNHEKDFAYAEARRLKVIQEQCSIYLKETGYVVG